MLKTEDNPPISWPQDRIISEFEGLWWIAHTKSRNEKALAHDLIRKSVGYFLPMDWNVSRRRGRTVRSLLPLFSGYLFFCGDEKNRLEVLRTNRVANLLNVADQERLVAELSQIERVLRAGASLKPHDYIKAGQICRIIAGPFAELQGIVSKRAGRTRLVLQIETLGRATSLEVDEDMIEPVD